MKGDLVRMHNSRGRETRVGFLHVRPAAIEFVFRFFDPRRETLLSSPHRLFCDVLLSSISTRRTCLHSNQPLALASQAVHERRIAPFVAGLLSLYSFSRVAPLAPNYSGILASVLFNGLFYRLNRRIDFPLGHFFCAIFQSAFNYSWLASWCVCVREDL
jgi:hypothetical protein